MPPAVSCSRPRKIVTGDNTFTVDRSGLVGCCSPTRARNTPFYYEIWVEDPGMENLQCAFPNTGNTHVSKVLYGEVSGVTNSYIYRNAFS